MLTAFILQVAFSGALLGWGLFFIVFYENYLFTVALIFFYQYLLHPLFWGVPHFMIICAGIGFLFAYVWFKNAYRPCDEPWILIFSALMYLVIVGLFIGPTVWYFLIVMAGPEQLGALILGILYLETPLNFFFLCILALTFFPALIVLVAGGGAYLYNHLSAPPIADSTVAMSPRGVRTSHSILASALRREKDKTRRTNPRR